MPTPEEVGEDGLCLQAQSELLDEVESSGTHTSSCALMLDGAPDKTRFIPDRRENSQEMKKHPKGDSLGG